MEANVFQFTVFAVGPNGQKVIYWTLVCSLHQATAGIDSLCMVVIYMYIYVYHGVKKPMTSIIPDDLPPHRFATWISLTYLLRLAALFAWTFYALADPSNRQGISGHLGSQKRQVASVETPTDITAAGYSIS